MLMLHISKSSSNSDGEMKDKILNLTPARRELLKRCVEAHRRELQETYPLGFQSSDVRAWPGEVKALQVAGLLERSPYSSRRSVRWWIRNIDEVEEAISETETSSSVMSTAQATPVDLFSPIIGYDDIKELILRSLDTRPVHFLLAGPPACAKTLFLMELERLPKAMPCLGSSTTKVGILDLLLDYQPSILIIDELEHMDSKDYAVLLSLCEAGFVSETKHGKIRSAVLDDTRVFAAANRLTPIPKPLLSRLQILRFIGYTKEQFAAICSSALVQREGLPAELAEYIGQQAWKLSQDVRQAVRVARLVGPKGDKSDVDRLLETLTKYLA